MLRYVIVMAAFSTVAQAAEVEASYSEVLKKHQLAERCGLRVNDATEAWIENFRQFLSEGEYKVSMESAKADAEALVKNNPIRICIITRARLFEDGWL